MDQVYTRNSWDFRDAFSNMLPSSLAWSRKQVSFPRKQISLKNCDAFLGVRDSLPLICQFSPACRGPGNKSPPTKDPALSNTPCESPPWSGNTRSRTTCAASPGEAKHAKGACLFARVPVPPQTEGSSGRVPGRSTCCWWNGGYLFLVALKGKPTEQPPCVPQKQRRTQK